MKLDVCWAPLETPLTKPILQSPLTVPWKDSGLGATTKEKKKRKIPTQMTLFVRSVNYTKREKKKKLYSLKTYHIHRLIFFVVLFTFFVISEMCTGG